jgi:diguanylate cyclase (GGDEF)-like protein/PAS domain S-box-containing protein
MTPDIRTELSRDQLLEIVDAAPAALVVVDTSWRLRLVGREALSFLGLHDDDVLGRDLWEVCPDLVDGATRADLARCLAEGAPIEMEVLSPVLRRWIRVAATHVSFGLAMKLRDVHEQHETTERLHRQDTHYRRVLQQSGLIAARVDTDLRYVWVDNVHPAFDPSSVIGKRDYDLDDNAGTHALVALKREVIDTRQSVRQEITFPVGTEERTYAVHGEPLFDEHGTVIGMTTVSLDVTDMRRVEVAAHTDYLTGAHNRLGIDGLIAQEIVRTERYGSTFSVILLDIDHFKAVNDAHGHQVGDHVLREVVACLRLELRSVDQIGRWGGEEFLLLLPEADGDEAGRAAERLRERVAAHRFAPAGPLTISSGVATWRPGETQAALVARADAALYRAKDGGRNVVVADVGDRRA